MIRKILICTIVQLAVLNLSAQRDYKDLYENLKNMKDYEAFQTLFDYQAATTTKDYANVNGYYQLGLISQKMMRQYDPFLQAGNVAQCISNAKTYFSITLHYFTEKEAKKNGKYYQEVTSPTYENIKKDIETRVADVEEYEKHFVQNITSLTAGITKYNVCLETFGKINAQNSRLNDLYFLVDEGLKTNLKDLKTNFDSTLYCLDELKQSLEKYPMGNYKIDYSLLPVPVYRLHGLTSSNFIAKNATLWNFNSWIDAFNAALNTDVDFLYKKADETNKINAKYLDKLANFDKSDVPPDYAINPLIVNKIYKYDFNSVVAPLLQYQANKVRFAYQVADNVVDKNLSSTNDFAKSNSYYFDLTANKKTVDSMLKLTAGKAVPEAVKKYKAFFDSNYKGFDGFQSYLKKEADDNNRILRKAMDAYMKNVKEFAAATPAANLQYKNEAFHANVVLPEKASAQGYYVHSKSVLANKKVFVSGSYIDAKSATLAFAALLNEQGEIEWLKVLDKKEGKNYGLLTGFSDKGFVVVASAENNRLIANYLYLLNEKGEVVKNLELAPPSVPRKLIFDNIDETLLIAFKGDALAPQAVSNDVMQVIMLKSDLTEAWSYSLQFSGYLSNVIKTNNRFYFYGACSEIKAADGKTTATRNRKINAFVDVLDANGGKIALKIFNADFAYTPLLVTKINNEYVDIISATESGQSYYSIISSNNEISYEF